MPPLQTFRLSGGTDLAYRTAGDPGRPAVVLIHGFPNSSSGFRDVIDGLAQAAFVVAPDMPGSGGSQPLAETTFDGFTDAVEALLAYLKVGRRFLYVHDFGSPVAMGLALRAPEQVLGLIVQNGNAHESGMDPELWADTFRYWTDPSSENERKATAHLTHEGVRDQYFSNVPEDVAARIEGAPWDDDWAVMRQPDRMAAQRALVRDNRHQAARFDDWGRWLRERQPPALLLWGRHDPYFAIDEAFDWIRDLPRMEAHILDAGHLLLETHAADALPLMVEFIRRTAGRDAGL